MIFITQTSLKKVSRLLVMFLIFHFFWFLFYLLADSPFFQPNNFHFYIEQSVINSIGFFAFSICAFWMFPFFLLKKRYVFMLLIAAGLVAGLGYLQYLTQEWFISAPETNLTSTGDKGAVMAASVTQALGAPVRAMLNIFVYMLLGAGYAYMKDWFIKEQRTRSLEKEKLQAELTLLRYQLNPHFLFNTINNIYYLAIIQSDKTADAILKVSNLLRYVLNEKEDLVTLGKEVDHLKEFIRLQQFRFPDQAISLELHTDKMDTCQIAPLLLITFAENAFKHGEAGTEEDPIHISLNVLNRKLTYDVTNKINRNAVKDSTTGIGLNNLRRRLSLLYRECHELTLIEENGYFKAHLEIQL